MANQTKEISWSIPKPERYVRWDSSELTTGDVLRIFDSLHRPADTITITTVGTGLALQVRFNSRTIVFKRRSDPNVENFQWAQNGYLNMATGVEVDSGVPKMDIGVLGAGQHIYNDLPVRDIEVTFSGTGTFTIVAS